MPESRGRKNKKPAYTPPPSHDEPKSNPQWWAPTMLTLMVLGLAWVVVTYVTQTSYPVPGIGSWNLAIGFGLIIAGFGMTLNWR